MLPPTDDTNRMRRVALNRDTGAFAEVYDQEAPRVLGLALRMLGRRDEAEDLLQEVFLYVWNRARDYDSERGSLAAWLQVITRSRCLDRLRQRSVRQHRELSLSSDEDQNLESTLPSKESTPLENLSVAEHHSQLTLALRELPEAQRQVIEWAYFQGLTQQEISLRTQEPLGTVKTRLRLGMMKLAESMRRKT